MGINLGALTAAEPSRRRDYARGVFRTFVCGNIACFMTACIAGMCLYIIVNYLERSEQEKLKVSDEIE